MFNINDIVGRDVLLENGAIGKVKEISESLNSNNIIVTIEINLEKKKFDIFSFKNGLVELVNKTLQADLLDWIRNNDDLIEVDGSNAEIVRSMGGGNIEPRPLIIERRNNNKPAIFLVCQKENYNDESRDGYIWAPNDSVSSHMELEVVRKGDIVFHHFGHQLKAISTVLGFCEQKVPPSGNHPDEIRRGIKGRYVRLQYILIQPPVNTRGLKHLKQQYGTDGTPAKRYRPFDINGNNQQGGYLYELPEELALAFIDEALKVNPREPNLLSIRNKI